MESYQARLESFSKAKRVKQASSKRAVAVKWPHPAHFAATPDVLAEAGFFFSPTWDDRDNAVCFLCEKELSGWEEEDDPFVIHWEKCRDKCAWAVVRCGLSEDVDRKGNFVFKDPSRLPVSKAMEKARLSTFKANSWWPHDQSKGHGASSSKMAKAGFVYTPQSSGDDTATCFYCHVSLSGWDDDDDPLEEHSKRVKKTGITCPFFPEAPAPALTKSTARAPSLRQSTKPKSRAGSKQPQPVASDVSDSASASEDEIAAPPAPPPKHGRTPSVTVAPVEKEPTDTLRRSTRGSKARATTSELEDEASGSELGRSKRGRGMKAKDKAKERIEVIEEEAEDDDIGKTPAVPKKGKGKGKENLVREEVLVAKVTKKGKEKKVEETDDEVAKPKRGRSKKKTAGTDDELAMGIETEADVKPTKKGKKKATEHPTDAEEEVEVKPRATKKPPSKSTARSKSRAKETSPPSEDEKGGSVEAQSDEVETARPRSTRIAASKPPSKTAKTKVKVVAAPLENGFDSTPEAVDADSDPPPKAVKSVKPKKLKVAHPVQPSDIEVDSEEEEEEPAPAPVKKPKKTKSTASIAPREPRSRTTTQSSASGSISSKQNGAGKTARMPPSSSVSSVEVARRDAMEVDEEVHIPHPALSRQATVDKSLSMQDPPAFTQDSDDDAAMEDAEEAVASSSLPSYPSPVRPPRSPERPIRNHRSPPQVESPATPPPASSSLPSLGSFNSSSTEVDETGDGALGTALPLSPSASLTDEERAMTVEQWIRHEIEVQYDRLRSDGEMKLRLFKERAEEVRHRIEAL